LGKQGRQGASERMAGRFDGVQVVARRIGAEQLAGLCRSRVLVMSRLKDFNRKIG